MGGGYITMFVFCPANSFWNQLLLGSISDEISQEKHAYIIILYLKFKLSNQNIVFLPRDEVISHCISLLKWDSVNISRCHGSACTRKHRLASFRKQKWRNVRRSKFTNQRLSTFFNNGECLYLYEKMYNDCFYHRSGVFFCNYFSRIC